MTAAEIVDEVWAAGAKITVDGDYLELAAPSPLPDELLGRVAVHKPEIMKILRRQDTEAEDLREYFEERAGILEYDGGLPRAGAEREAAKITAAYARNQGYLWSGTKVTCGPLCDRHYPGTLSCGWRYASAPGQWIRYP